MKYVYYIALLCFVVVISYNQFSWIYVKHLPVFVRVAPDTLGQTHDHPKNEKKMVFTLSKKTNRLVDSLIRGSAVYWYYRYHWDWYLSTDTHIDTLICFPLIYINIMFYMLCIKCFAENTAHTRWLSRMITSILNIKLSILNPMVIFTCSPHFSKLLGVMPFAIWIFAKIAQIHPQISFFCLHIFNDNMSTLEAWGVITLVTGLPVSPWPQQSLLLICGGYPAKRALFAMRNHGRYGPFGRIPTIFGLR